MPEQQGERPYLKIQVIESVLDDIYVLERIRDKFIRLHQTDTDFIKGDPPYLMIYFNSKEEMRRAYTRDSLFYETLLEILRERFSPEQLLGAKASGFLNPNQKSLKLLVTADLIPHIKEKYRPLYQKLLELRQNKALESSQTIEKIMALLPENAVVFKYSSNYKEFLQFQYNYFIKIAQALGVDIAYEEVLDGFIFFSSSLFTFEQSLIDLMDKNEILELLKKYDLLNDEERKFLDDLFNRMEMNKNIQQGTIKERS